MPCATIHMAVAGRVLDEWTRSPPTAPVDPWRAGVREAFLHGALAPDMGFIPGTHRLVSEAAHYLRPGDLTRALLQRANSAAEEAFAWGWASHLLADVRIHPLVGRAVGERLHGDRGRRIDAMEDVATHVSLEVGLDVAVLRGDPEIPRPPAVPFFPTHGGIRSFIRALAETYDLEWDPALLTQHHLRAVRLTRWWPRALGLLPLHPPGPPAGDRMVNGAGLHASVFERIGRLRGPETPLAGFLAPEAPRRWFLDAVQEEIETFPERFRELVRSGLDQVGNPNMETGEPTGVGRGHPATDLAAQKLDLARAERFPVPG